MVRVGARVVAAALSAWVGWLAPAVAEPLSDVLAELLVEHNRVKAAEQDLAGLDDRIRVAFGDWYPKLLVTSHYGMEEIDKPTGSVNTDQVTRVVDVNVTQKLWDFGKTNALVHIAGLSRDQAGLTLALVKQNLLLEGITAYLNVMKAHEVVGFARRSESNIKQQADLEDALVRRGAGLSTDVLQAKVQLAGAQSRRVQTEGLLQNSRNRYRAVFTKDAGAAETMAAPRIPVDLLPASIDDAVEIARENNPQLKVATIASQIAAEQVSVTRSQEFFPSLDAITGVKHKIDEAGTLGHQREFVAKVQLNFPFNLGLTGINSVRAAESAVTASTRRLADSRDTVEEQARNAWQNFMTARDNAEHLNNQANIAAEFLELARKERQLGNRSLIDVLAGETALLNASADAAAAETDVAVAAFTLLNAMGRLDLSVLSGPPARR